MIKKEILFKILIFLFVIVVAIFGERVEIGTKDLFLALFLFICFNIFNYHLTIQTEMQGMKAEYSINYGIAFAIYAGPIGLLLYEIFNYVSILLIKKWKKRTNYKTYLHTFYNITTFSAANLVAFYLYVLLWPGFSDIPFGFWFIFILIAIVTGFTSDTIILVYFLLKKEIGSLKEVVQFYNYWNLLDVGKTVMVNGLLFVFLYHNQWEYLIGLLFLTYFVNRSIMMKSKNILDKLERDKFEVMAYKDALTGADNRAFMDKKIEELSVSCETIGIVVADIDRFKMINDTYNHAVGDEILKSYVRYLGSYLKEEDFLFRSGGEEFTLFLRNRTYHETYELLENMRQDLEHTGIEIEFDGEPHTITYTSSYGLYYSTFSEASSLEKGYIYADNLLLKSKRLGRNRITAENGAVDNL